MMWTFIALRQALSIHVKQWLTLLIALNLILRFEFALHVCIAFGKTDDKFKCKCQIQTQEDMVL